MARAKTEPAAPKEPPKFFTLIPTDTKIDFVRLAPTMTAISMALCAISLVLLWTRGLNYGTDFAGGALVQVRFDSGTTAGDVRTALGRMAEGS